MPDVSYSLGGVRNEQQTEADRQRARMEQMMFQREIAQRAEAARQREMDAQRSQFDKAEENRRALLDTDIAARTEATRLQTGGAKDIAQMQLQAEAMKWGGERADKAAAEARAMGRDKAKLYADPGYRALMEKADLGDTAAKAQLDAINSAYDTAPSYGGGGGMPMGGGAAMGPAPAPMPAMGASRSGGSVFAQDHPEIFGGDQAGTTGPRRATFRSDGGYTTPNKNPYASAGLFTGLSNLPGKEGGYVPGSTRGVVEISRDPNPDKMFADQLKQRIDASGVTPSVGGSPAPAQAAPASIPNQTSMEEQLALTGTRKLAAGMIPSSEERTAMQSVQMREASRGARLKAGQDQVGKFQDELSTDKYGIETMDTLRSALNPMQDPLLGGALSGIANFFGAKTNAGWIDKSVEREGAKALMPLAQRFRAMQQAVKNREMDPVDFEAAKSAIANYLERVKTDSNASIIERFKQDNGL